MSRAISRSANYTRRFYLARERNLQKVKHIKQTLEQESHRFIVKMGDIICSIFCKFIAYNLTHNFIEYALLGVFLFALS